ncbi:16S rRNA (cytosine(1402)-N(4))-methyltransferase [Rickettsiella grylli]|uniref:16S rRNA (cytosine(1402)-N(4))-methyltransferase RsmH n=1 Tax=Rickettsiella grylli TaxID=59196 RepID=UPI0008FD5D7E|nr:16S rRNA (cytosine(1402)-N(4))-methyltransferase RsmH [Rickettsiella grylli]OJA00420.1 16S rRNA (cytosine(1402)-N(4))-methyltransferase [Rickettsiella grylli]
MQKQEQHQPVLLTEVIENLVLDKDGIYVDATFGRGGHAGQILQRLSDKGRCIAIDKDPAAIAFGIKQWGHDKRFKIYQGSFNQLKTMAEREGVINKVSGILFDLGVSSPQLEKAERGFSFLREGPLDMRMDPQTGVSAAEWLAHAKEKEIVKVLKNYGEERYAKRIARAIVEEQKLRPIVTTVQLANVVKLAHPHWDRFKHPATRTFQAIRIQINNELEDLNVSLGQSIDVLKQGGRLLVISFHSLEDRIVKRFIRQHAHEAVELKKLPFMPAEWKRPRLKKIGRGVKPDAYAIKTNPRSRSALLRIAEKIA